jgi:membrane-associated protease RseP (regulator of RpoE activity)
MDDVVGRPGSRSRFPAVHVALFVATLCTTLWAGFTQSPLAAHPTVGNVVRGGLPFAGSLIAILFTHEMGHYLFARRYQVAATLPYFIPVPFGFGTLGAVIRMRSAIPSRRAILDIGAAGPLAGLAVALPLYFLGLSLSEVRELPESLARAEAPSLLSAARWVLLWVTGHGAGGGEYVGAIYGDSALTWVAQRIVVGDVAPGYDVALHPVGVAAWLGLLVTTLNLVPLGQLDGGHVLYALFGRGRARDLSRLVSAALLLAGVFVSWNWFVWWLLTRFLVRLGHPPALDEEPLDPRRKAIAWLSLLLFALTFVPVPVSF